MYQNHSSTFPSWQHYYHQRQIGGPFYMTPITYDDGKVVESEANREQWITIWKKIRPSTKNGYVTVGSLERVKLYGASDTHEGHQLSEIVKNLPMEEIMGWTFQFLYDKEADAFKIKIEYCAQIDFLVKKLKPSDKDKEYVRVLNKAITKLNGSEENLKRKSLDQLNKELKKLEISEQPKKQIQTPEEDLSSSDDEDNVAERKRKEDLENAKKKMLAEIATLNKEFFDTAQSPVNELQKKSIETTLKRMKRMVTILEALRRYTEEDRKIKDGETEKEMKVELKKFKDENEKLYKAAKEFEKKGYGRYFTNPPTYDTSEKKVHIGTYTEDEIKAKIIKLDELEEIIKKIQKLKKKWRWTINNVDDEFEKEKKDLETLLENFKTEKDDREKEERENNKKINQAKKFNKKGYNNYFTNVPPYPDGVVPKDDVITIKARMTKLNRKVKQVEKLRKLLNNTDKYESSDDLSNIYRQKESDMNRAKRGGDKIAAEKYNTLLETYFKQGKRIPLNKKVPDQAETMKNITELQKKTVVIEKIRTIQGSEGFKADNQTVDQLKEICKKRQEEYEANRAKFTTDYAKDLFQPDVDMIEEFPIGLRENILFKRKVNETNIDSLLVKQTGKQTMVYITAPSPNFNVVHIEKVRYDASVWDSRQWQTWDQQSSNGKKTMELVKNDGEWNVRIMRNEGVTKKETVKRAVRDVCQDDKILKEVGTKFTPRPAQNTTIRAVSDDLLISHAPGKGKTFTAILKAEKKRNELRLNNNKLPRIVILAPNAVLLKQWQKEVIANGFDPRHYVFQTYNLFRNTFTTGRYAKWSDLDTESKNMIIGNEGCWRKIENVWSWKGKEEEGNHVEAYYNESLGDPETRKELLDKLFFPALKLNIQDRMKTRGDLVSNIYKKRRGGKGPKVPAYIQDTVTNQYLNANKLFLDSGKIRPPANKLDPYEEKVLVLIQRRTDFYLLHQEDIFLHHSPVNGDEYRYIFFTNMKTSSRIDSILEDETTKMRKDMYNWRKKYKEDNGRDPTADETEAKEAALEKAIEKKKEKRAQEEEAALKSGDFKGAEDAVTKLDKYGGRVPFVRRPFKGEEEDGKDSDDVYDPKYFIEFLTDELTQKNGAQGSDFKDKIPQSLKNKLNKVRGVPPLSTTDTFQDVNRVMMESNEELTSRVKSKLIDKFVTSQHGLDLSQHRYQVNPENSILIMDEAHDKEAITDNVGKISTKVVFEFLKKTKTNLFVTATPMQSEKPSIQLWLFAKALEKDQDGKRLGIEEVKAAWKKEKLEAVEKLEAENKKREEEKTVLTNIEKGKLKRRRKYEEKFAVVRNITKKISRSFEMELIQKKLFLQSVLSDLNFHETLPMVLALDRRMGKEGDAFFSYFNTLKKSTKEAILKKIGDMKFKVKEGVGFTNPFPYKMRMLTPFDKGFMRSYMDEVRMNVCRYAERDENKVYYDFTTRAPNTTLPNSNKQYDSYGYNSKDPNGYQHKNFDKDLSRKLFGRCKYRLIPIVVNKSKYYNTILENNEVDARIMEKLWKDAFYHNDDENTFQPLKVPILADTEDEAWDLLGRVLLKSYRQNVKKGRARKGRTIELMKDRTTDETPILDYIKECTNEMLPKEEDDDDTLYEQIKKAKWMHYEPTDDKGTEVMPYIPTLMSSKYKDICELLLKKDKEHVNGIVYHKNYEVHYQLAHSLMAHGAKQFDATSTTFLNTNVASTFVDNAKKKILNKWNDYIGEKFHYEAQQKEGNPTSQTLDWSPTYEIKRLKYWGKKEDNYESRFYEDEENKSDATIRLHELINKLGEALEKTLDDSEEWTEKDGLWVATEMKKKRKLIEYIKSEDKEYGYVQKVYRLKEPVIRSDFGKYYAIDDDESSIMLYEGRNGSDLNGPSNDYQGPVIVPATLLEYLYYVTFKVSTKFIGVWTVGNDSNRSISPLITKSNLRNSVYKMLAFSMESYDKDFSNHDDRFDTQRQIRELMKRAEKLTISDYYSDLEMKQEVALYKNLKDDYTKLQSAYCERTHKQMDFNYLLNVELFNYIQYYLVVKPINYNRKYPGRMFATVTEKVGGLKEMYDKLNKNRSTDKGFGDTINNSLKALAKTLDDKNKDKAGVDATKKFPKRLHDMCGRPRYITLQMITFLNSDKVQEFLKITPAVEKKLTEYTKGSGKKMSDRQKSAKAAQAFLQANDNNLQKLIQDAKTQDQRKAVISHIQIIADAIFAVDVEIKVEAFNKDPTTENLLALKEEPFLKDYYKSSRSWTFASTIKKRTVTKIETKELTAVELKEKIMEAATDNVSLLPPYTKDFVEAYFQDKYKKMTLQEIQNEANGMEIPIFKKKKDGKFSKSNESKATLEKKLVEKKINGSVFDTLYKKPYEDFKDEIESMAIYHLGKQKKAQLVAIYERMGGSSTGTKQVTTEEPYEVRPDTNLSWYKRNFATDGGSITFYDVVKEDNYNEKPSFQNPREGVNYRPYDDKINETKNSIGLRVETIISSKKAKVGFSKMLERHRALNPGMGKDTFLSFMFYNARDTSGIVDKDLVKQAHEAGLIDFLIMSGTGITGVDLQSTRQSLMVMVEPSKSPGLKDQFVGRLIRNVSHGIIPRIFQRVEHVTFFNACKRASDGITLSQQIQPWPYFKDWAGLKQEAETQRDIFDYSQGPETKEDRDAIVNDGEKDGEYIPPSKEEEQSSDDIDEMKEPEQAAMDINNLLEDTMLYARRSKRQRKETPEMIAYKAQKKEAEQRIQNVKEFKKLMKKVKRKPTKKDMVNFAKKVWNDGNGSEAEDKVYKKLEEKNWGYIDSEGDIQPLMVIEDAVKAEDLEEDDDALDDLVELSEDEKKRRAEAEAIANELDAQQNDTDTTYKDAEAAEYDRKGPRPKEEEKKRRVGGKLDRLVDSQIDNHVNISAVITVGNHAFTTVRQYLESNFTTTVDLENDTSKGSGKFLKGVEIPFGYCCYNCHYENEMEATECEVCGLTLQKHYYKHVEYTNLKQILNTEVAKPITPIYPLSGDNVTDGRRPYRYMKPNGTKIPDAWTRQENMLWNYKTGFYAKLVERDQLRYLLSMVTVEHYLRQQKEEIKSYEYVDEQKESDKREGSIHIKTTTKTNENPYAWENRQKEWYELVWPQKMEALGDCPGRYESKVASDIEFEYLSEYESDIESEYSD